MPCFDEYVTIPSHQLRGRYQRVLARDSMGEVKAIADQLKKMLEAILDRDEKKVAEILEAVHERKIPFLKYSDENDTSC